jgi:putative membrane protein insertion efficiency factor
VYRGWVPSDARVGQSLGSRVNRRLVPRILRRSELYVGALTLIVLAVAWDTGRRPENQVTARVYVGAVRTYEAVLGPRLTPAVQCRFHPTCSQYSIEAVRRFGIRRGLALTARRVLSCRPGVPPGTLDPVPPLNKPR